MIMIVLTTIFYLIGRVIGFVIKIVFFALVCAALVLYLSYEKENHVVKHDPPYKSDLIIPNTY